MHYALSARLTSPPTTSLKAIRERARRHGYLLSTDYTTSAFTLVDANLRLPILGLDHVGLPEIACAIEHLRNNKS
jgi:hypothetical protein